jgi:hypothetical protein
VTKIDADKCFSRYGSIKFSQRGGLMRGFNPKIEKDNASATGSNLQKAKNKLVVEENS